MKDIYKQRKHILTIVANDNAIEGGNIIYEVDGDNPLYFDQLNIVARFLYGEGDKEFLKTCVEDAIFGYLNCTPEDKRNTCDFNDWICQKLIMKGFEYISDEGLVLSTKD